MLKIKTLALCVFSACVSSNALAYEVLDNFKVGAYGGATFADYDGSGTQVIKSNTNGYVDLEFKEKFQFMVDVNYQTNQQDLDSGESSSFNEADLYQAFAAYNTQSFSLKVGRFADFYAKGENALNVSEAIVDPSFAPLTVLGQSTYSTIDGLALTYRAPLHGGIFSGTFFSGNNTQKYAYDQEIGMELTGEGMKYGVHFNIEKGNHNFILGGHLAELDKVDLANKVVDDTKTNDYFNYYSAYRYDNDMFFSDNVFMAGKFDEGDTDIEQTIIDFKLGAKFMGFKPFIGMNYFKNMAEKYETMTYGVRYDYKGIGAMIKRDQIEKKEGITDIDDHRTTFSVFYSF